MKIVFMGTPAFAVPSLQILCENNFDVVGVITSVDKPAGRGKKIRSSPVKKYAEEQGLHILQPKNLKSPAFLEELKSLEADLQIVVAFRMLPALVFEMPAKGCINLHGSLLPNYRGAAPINWAVINGEKETGVTTFFIEQQIDTGAIIFQEKIPIGPSDTAGELHDRMMHIGAEVVLKTVQAVEKDDYPCEAQNLAAESKKAPKIFKQDCLIDWEWPAEKIINFVRGLSPYPASFSYLGDKKIKIFSCKIPELEQSILLNPGELFLTENKQLLVGTGDEAVAILDVQLESRKRMLVEDFLRGIDISSLKSLGNQSHKHNI